MLLYKIILMRSSIISIIMVVYIYVAARTMFFNFLSEVFNDLLEKFRGGVGCFIISGLF